MIGAVDLTTAPAIDAGKIIAAFGAARGVDVTLVTDKRNRAAGAVWPRHELGYLLHKLGGMTQPEIGQHTGGRDASSVSAGLSRIRQRCEEDPAYAAVLSDLTKKVWAACTAVAHDAPSGPGLARRLMSEPEIDRADVEALAVCTMSAVAILGAKGLSDSDARRAALGVLCQYGVHANG